MKKKGLIGLTLSAALLITTPVPTIAAPVRQQLQLQYDGKTKNYADPIVFIEIDGKIVETGDMPGILLEDSTLVPAREVYETIGAEVEWDGEKKEVYITLEDKQITLTIDETKAYVNGEEKELEVPAKLITNVEKMESKTMIPFRFVAESLGYEVTWDPNNYIAKASKVATDEGENIEDSENGGDQENNGDEQEDEGTQEDENVELSTPLKDNPIIWEGEGDLPTTGQLDETGIEVVREPHSIVDITNIRYLEDGGPKQFFIEASGPITDVETTEWDGKLIFDIENSKMDLSVVEEDFDNNEFAYRARSSQFKETPMVTRVVFDLIRDGFKYDVRLSEDRKQIIVSMETNTINRIEVNQDDEGDVVSIEGTAKPILSGFRLTDPDRLVFDIPNAKSSIKFQEAEVEGQYLTNVRTSQFDEDTVRVVLEIDDQADYALEYDGKETKIHLQKPSYNDVKYHNVHDPSIALRKNKDNPIDTSKIIHTDNYLNKEYILTLPGNYSGLYGQGSIQIQDGSIKQVELQTNNNQQTEVRIHAEQIYAYEITEDENNIYITAIPPIEKYKRIVVIDPGHGGKDPGAQSHGMNEKDVNLDISLVLYNLLEQDPNYKVYITRFDDSYPTLQDRCDIANEVQADLFVSVHNNAYMQSYSGAEVLYSPHNSSISTAEKNKYRASLVEQAIEQYLNIGFRGLKPRPDLYVLNHTKMPALLVEVAYMTNDSDAAKLATKAFKDQAAYAIYEGIIGNFTQFPTGR